MNILLASSEVVPFAKTGGLADVTAALPVELARLGHQTVVIMPAYRQALQCGQPIEPTGISLEIPIGSKVVSGRLLRSQLPGVSVPVYLIEQDEYFDRNQLYREDGEDYKDNCERFVFFCRAVMESIRLLELDIDVIHCNDWQTGLIPAYLSIEYRAARGYENIATLFTIHNLAYQGQFWHWDMLLTGLDWKYFNWNQMEFYGHLNLMKTGIVFADAINTVSPRYAQEIQGHELGCGLEGVLQHRSDVLSGIINGVDYGVWDPATDEHIAANYNVQNWREGKARCKAAIQRGVGLPEQPDVPLLGLIGRLADQKGFDLVADVMERWAEQSDAQWVVLGTGEAKYHALLASLAERYPDKIAACLEFSNKTAHRIEAGADIFLMPSRYEPCGLNQLYSLRYGTVPVVNRTGGLFDTITDASPQAQQDGTANGFGMSRYTSQDLEATLQRACLAYNQPETWDQIVTTGMRQDWSWTHSAQQYVALYKETLARLRQTVCA